MSEAIQLVAGKPDVELAEEIKERLIVALRPALDIMSEARKAGLQVQFGIGPDATGREMLTALQIIRVLVK